MRRCLEASVGVGLLLLFAGAFLLSLGILDGRAGAAWVNPLQKAAAGKYSAGGTLDPRNDLDKVFGEPQAQTVEPAAGAPAGASSSAAIAGAAQTLTASVSVQVSYIYAGRKIAAVDGSGLHFMHSDHLGTASVVSSAAAAVESASRQLPFGAQIGSLTRETDFTGKKPDAGTGNTYFGARYFSPSEGRFMQADPILRQTVSNYAYGNNNPLTMIDPTGAGPEMALPAPWLIGGIAALGAGMVALAQDQDSQAAGQAMAETFEDVSRKVGDFLFGSGAAVASSPGPSSIEAALVPATAAADVLSYTTKPQAKAHSGSQARATEAAEAATAESAQWVTYVHYTDTKSAKSVAKSMNALGKPEPEPGKSFWATSPAVHMPDPGQMKSSTGARSAESVVVFQSKQMPDTARLTRGGADKRGHRQPVPEFGWSNPQAGCFRCLGTYKTKNYDPK